MATDAAVPREVLPAGDFGEWLGSMLAVLRGSGEADVPCGTCVGCCVSSYHLVIRRADRAGVAPLGEEWLRTAPGLAPGDSLLGYRDNGHCPALQDRQCSIYAQRPMTCRDYDCRIFAAAGIAAGGADKAVINERVAAWQFAYSSEDARAAHAAIRDASRFIRENGTAFPGGRGPSSPTGIAVLALKSYRVFLDDAEREPRAVVQAMIEASRQFDAAAV